jgi:hypothetical protein
MVAIRAVDNAKSAFRADRAELPHGGVPVHRRGGVRHVRVPRAGRGRARRLRLGALLQAPARAAARRGQHARALRVSRIPINTFV